MSAATPTAGAAAPLLELRHVDAGYGPFRSLFDVSFSIDVGGSVALIGPNGAGKTTVARVCSGLLTPTSGSLLIDGADVTGEPAHVIAGRGVAHAPEGRSVFATLTIEENLVLSFHSALGAKATKGAVERAYEMFPRLGERRSQLAGSLSGGEQRMLTMSRALVLEPRLLIADELSLGLAPLVTDEVYKMLDAVRAAGTALLIVEQHLDHALAVADRVVVLEAGEVVFSGAVADLGDRASGFLGG